MMKRNPLSLSLITLILGSTNLMAEVILKSGRVMDPNKSFRAAVRYGQVTKLTGSVEETSRLVTRRTGRSAGDLPESYDLEELGFSDGADLLGLTLEKQWSYFTLNFRGNYAQAEASQRAVRDFYLGVDEVKYRGKSYEYLKIPKGDAYDAELNNFFMHLTLRWTPFTFYGTEKVAEFTPWVGIGLYGILSDYQVESGESRGVVLSEFPPREYVVGGKGDGTNGGAVPEIGIGGQLKLGLTDHLNFEAEGHVGYVKYDGSTSAIGIESRNVKNLDMEYLSIELSARLVFNISDETDFYIGASWESVDSTAYTSSDEGQTDAEILAKREKFDKDIELNYSFLSAEIGWLF